MSARAIAAGAIAVVAVVAAVLLISGGGRDETSVRLVLDSSLGLRDDSEVRVGGVPVGQVRHLGLTPDDHVELVLGVRNDAASVGEDASITVKSLNLLGEKYVELDPGTPSADQARTITIPAGRVTPATDLDQVLNVLDTPTRTRLAVLINEAGIGLTGRHADFNELLQKLPPSLSTVTDLLDEVVADNVTLARLISHSDRFLARTVEETDDLRRFVDSAEGAARTFASRNEELAATLAAAPGGLATLRAFLVDLENTAQPLGAAARRLSATAPHLEDTLEELAPFRNTIRPTLRQASDVAPSLSRLGEQAAPVIEKSGPALASLDEFADAAEPTVAVLGDSAMPDILGLLEGWGRSIQGRDGLSHQFHGRASVGTDFFRHLISSYPEKTASKAKRAGDDRKPSSASEAEPEQAPAARPPAESRAKHVLDDLADKVKGLTGNVLEKVKEAAGKIGSRVKDTVGRLIGKLKAERRSGDAGRTGDSVNKLLDYLVGP